MKTGDLELWWDSKIHVTNKVTDLIIWDRKRKECKIIDFCVPLDGNVTRKEIEKVNNYVPLVNELQQIIEIDIEILRDFCVVHHYETKPSGKNAADILVEAQNRFC